MKRVSFFLLVILNLTGCTSYKDYTNAHVEFAKTENTRIENTPIVLAEVMKVINESFDSNLPKDVYESKPLYIKTTRLVSGEVVTETFNSDSDKFMMYLMAVERSKAKMEMMQFILPFVKEIMTQKQLQLDRPVMAGDVLMEFAKHTPLIVTALGMYGIATEMADKIGNKISANLTDGSTIGISGSGDISTSNTVLPPEEVIEEEVIE